MCLCVCVKGDATRDLLLLDGSTVVAMIVIPQYGEKRELFAVAGFVCVRCIKRQGSNGIEAGGEEKEEEEGV